MTLPIKIAILAIAVILLAVFIFKDNSLKRNINLLWALAIIVVLVIVILWLFSSVYKDIGEGELLSNLISNGAHAQEERETVENGILYIEVSQSDIIIGEKTYYSVSAVIPILQEAKSRGASKVQITDNYAIASTYEGLLSVVKEEFETLPVEEQIP